MITQGTIDAVRERVDIVALIRENVRLEKRGRSWLGLCPFHKEKTPSFNVNPERGFFHCFGCGESGDAISYLVKLEGHTFPEAVRALAERFGIPVEEDRPRDDARLAEKRREKDELYEVMNLAAAFYERQLVEHPLRRVALEALAARALPYDGDEATRAVLAAFRIGYAPYGWDGLASYFHKHGVRAALAEKLGLIVPRQSGSGHYDAFRHRLMFAVMDRTGRVVAFSGRALDEPDGERLRALRIEPMSRPQRPADAAAEPRRPPPKYVNSPESPIYVKGETVFGLYQARLAVRESGVAVLVEGNFDVVALHARGVSNAVAPLGTAFTVQQAKLIKRYAPQLVVLFDGDAAGRKAAVALREPAREAGLSVKVASMPEGSDPDALSRDKGVAAIEGLIRGAKGMLEYLIDETLSGSLRGDGGSLEGTHARIQRVMQYIAEEDDPNLRALAKAYADRISSQLVVAGQAPGDTRALERMIRQAATAPGAPARVQRQAPPELGPRAKSAPRPEEQDLEALGAILDFPELTLDPSVQDGLNELSGDVAWAAAAIGRIWASKMSLPAGELLDLLPQAIHSFAVGRLATPRFAEVEEARSALLDNIAKIRRRSLTGDKAVKVQALDRAKGQGDVDAQDELLRELERVARMKRGLS